MQHELTTNLYRRNDAETTSRTLSRRNAPRSGVISFEVDGDNLHPRTEPATAFPRAGQVLFRIGRELLTDLAAMVFGEPYDALAINPQLRTDPKVTEAYLGRYEAGEDFFIPRASINVEKRGDSLAMVWSIELVSWLAPVTESKFYDRIFGASVTFVKGDTGKVSHLTFRVVGTDYRANKIQN